MTSGEKKSILFTKPYYQIHIITAMDPGGKVEIYHVEGIVRLTMDNKH